jgi:hypothetical protein
MFINALLLLRAEDLPDVARDKEVFQGKRSSVPAPD